MILGTGIDIVEIARIRKLLDATVGSRFLQRVLTEEERRLAHGNERRIAEFTAGRFAAKEAVVKALGCGIGQEVGFQDISILPDAWGKPECALSGDALQRLRWKHEIRLHLSISHSEQFAVANAIVEKI